MVASVGKKLSWRDVISSFLAEGYVEHCHAISCRDSEDEGSRFLQALECDSVRGFLGTSNNCIFELFAVGKDKTSCLISWITCCNKVMQGNSNDCILRKVAKKELLTWKDSPC